jgi:hypothetical protein
MTETETNHPRVGAPTDDYRAVCSFALRPGAPACTDVAVRHLLVTSAKWGVVSLASCVDHLSIARLSGVCHQEHAFDSGVCDLPGALWIETENRCAFDVSGIEPVLVEAGTAQGEGGR